MEHHHMSLLHLPLHLNQLKQIHALVVVAKYLNISSFVKLLLNNSLVNYARILFDEIPLPDQNLCNSMVSTYSRLSLHKEAIEAFFLIQNKKTTRIRMACLAFPPVIKSCTFQQAVGEGKQVHSLALRSGLGSNAFIQTSLIDFYWKTCDLDSAERVFGEVSDKDPVSYNCLIAAYSRFGRVLGARRLFDEMPIRTTASWTSMISCYAHNGDPKEGLRTFEWMLIESAWPNESTLVTVLSISAKLGDLEMGLKIKKFLDDNNLCRNMILSTALLEMYVKCGAIDDARREFDGMVRRDVVAWSAMIAGYAQNGRSNEALELFEEMKINNIKPNDVTLVSILSACGQLGSVEAGKGIGNYVESEGLSSNVYVGSALLDMYAKCGNIGKARQVFNEMPEKDAVAWNSMIAGLAFNGFEEEAINLYFQMNDTDVRPNDITFTALLTACTHAGLVQKGCHFFECMQRDHNIIPQVEHCACVVDLFCRSGRLEEAYEFICKMDVEPNVVIWGSLLSACRINSNVELAECAVEKLLVLEPENSGNYVLLSNLYASVGRWEESLKMRALMKEKGVQKTAAYSWIEVDGMVHRFLVEDESHPSSGELYSVVDGLSLQLKSARYSLNSFLEFSS